MFSSARSRIAALSTRSGSFVPRAGYSSTAARLLPEIQANDPTPRQPKPNVSVTNATPTDAVARDAPLQETPEAGERSRQMQAPNRANTWARGQQPRAQAMTGPRFEQTIFEAQPQPLAAIELIHKQPVRWMKERIAVCDGGGGPLGHPRIFINVDKPQINHCTYCGLPFAHEHHRAYLESLPETTYPLKATGDPVEANETQRVTESGWEQR